jgi:hypothetical protein
MGFASMRALIAMVADDESAEELRSLQRKLEKLATLPSGGATPFFLSLAPAPAAPDGSVSLRVAAAFPITTTLDLIQWLQ